MLGNGPYDAEPGVADLMPRNARTNRRYRGMNVLALWSEVSGVSVKSEPTGAARMPAAGCAEGHGPSDAAAPFSERTLRAHFQNLRSRIRFLPGTLTLRPSPASADWDFRGTSPSHSFADRASRMGRLWVAGHQPLDDGQQPSAEAHGEDEEAGEA